jgi:N6-L-threonylcarbamoyladenine synthase
MNLLGIESSCDETAASVVREDKTVLSNVIYSQTDEHSLFRGVVPEIAARAHLEKIDLVVKKSLSDANLDISDITAVAGTCGPGLIGGVIVGATFAKSIAMARRIPFIAINHIEAHALSIRLTEDVDFPYLLLLASGGHCQLCIVHAIDRFEVIGKSLDDSVGESFDKVAKLLGFGYPGGPIVEKMSKSGDDKAFLLPRPLCQQKSCDFSFSGLKTAVRINAEKCANEQDRIDLCASFQTAVTDVLVYKVKQALEFCRNIPGIQLSSLVMAGGVAANNFIRSALQNVCEQRNIRFLAPPINLCTDNGAMIAWLGVEKLMARRLKEEPCHKYYTGDDLRFAPRPRWSLS